MFAIFLPVEWPCFHSPEYIPDPSARSCILSLVNAHDRSFRLRLKAGQEKFAAYKSKKCGPSFGCGGDVGVWALAGGESFCDPKSFELDQEAEEEAGLPELEFAYDKSLLSGIDDGEGNKLSQFEIDELECYTLDA